MIQSFKCKETEKVFNGIFSKKFPIDLQSRAFNKLAAIHVSLTLEDLRSPPSNHLEQLKGNRKDQYSIRINSKYRICFKWNEGFAEKVEITDYHD